MQLRLLGTKLEHLSSIYNRRGASPATVLTIPKIEGFRGIPAFSDSQFQGLLNAIDTRTAEEYRDCTIILTLLDTALRVSELCNLKLGNLWLDEGMLKVVGKGNKERLIPIALRAIGRHGEADAGLPGV